MHLPELKPIGLIHSPYQDPQDTPIQSSRSNAEGWVEVYPEYAEGLEGIEGFSHLILLYVWHRAPAGLRLKVKPFLADFETGLFATRYPCRPNPIGISVVRLLERQGCHLRIQGVDVLDGTPLLDIKPYVPDFDVFTPERTGWYEQVKRAKSLSSQE